VACPRGAIGAGLNFFGSFLLQGKKERKQNLRRAAKKKNTPD
jgi:hypothetical protein